MSLYRHFSTEDPLPPSGGGASAPIVAQLGDFCRGNTAHGTRLATHVRADRVVCETCAYDYDMARAEACAA
jgi:hypothetical protein